MENYLIDVDVKNVSIAFVEFGIMQIEETYETFIKWNAVKERILKGIFQKRLIHFL